MTMKLTVKNEDAHRVAVVQEKDESIHAYPQSETCIGPGESRTFYIHAAKSLMITEDPNG